MAEGRTMEAGICPCCGSDDLQYDAIEVHEWVYYPFTCNSCGCRGQENYALTFDDHTIIEEGRR